MTDPKTITADTVTRLRNEVAYWRSAAEHARHELDMGVSEWRDRVMRDATRLWDRGHAHHGWVVATRQIPRPGEDDDGWGVLHHRDPAAPPRIIPPAGGSRARYLTGEIRDAGPGSHIGKALCGLPLMADELWVRADHVIQAAARHAHPNTELCGRCSYLAGTPTMAAAWEAIKP